MKKDLSEFIAREILGSQTGEGPTGDDDLLGSGMVDSLGVMSLVFFIEERFGVEVPPEDVTIDNFQTIDAIASYLERRSG